MESKETGWRATASERAEQPVGSENSRWESRGIGGGATEDGRAEQSAGEQNSQWTAAVSWRGELSTRLERRRQWESSIEGSIGGQSAGDYRSLLESTV